MDEVLVEATLHAGALAQLALYVVATADLTKVQEDLYYKCSGDNHSPLQIASDNLFYEPIKSMSELN